MKKALQQQAILLTKELLERYWQHDYKFALSKMSEDVVWIGSTQEQYMQGLEKVTVDFVGQDKEIVSCHLSHEEFKVIHHTTNSISIAGMYLVTTDPDTGLLLQVWQRCFMVYEYNKGEFILKGLHVSNPMGELHLDSDEAFPTKLGKQSYQYMMDSISTAKDDRKLMISAKDRSIHFFYESEIVCVESFDHDIVITLQDRQIIARISISSFYSEHKNALVRTQRSLLVNPLHIHRIHKNIITMDAGKELRIPPKSRAKAVKSIEDFLAKQ